MSEGIRLSREQVKGILPHREPMLLIDEVINLIPGREIAATFFVDPGMEILAGHFPGNPILPGVYSIEAAAQAAGLVLMTLDRYRGKIPLLLGVSNAKFKRKALPGSSLEILAGLLAEREEKGIATFACTLRSGGESVAEVELALAMREWL